MGSPGTITSSAPCLAYRAAASDGVTLSERVLVQRVEWAINLAYIVAKDLLATIWNPRELDQLATGSDRIGRRLPSKGWVAACRLGWDRTPTDFYIPSRLRRCSQEQIVRTMRGAAWRATVSKALLDTWPAQPKRTQQDWDALWAAVPPGTTKVNVRNHIRQIMNWAKVNGRMPGHLCDMEGLPRLAPELLLAACDKQLVYVERAESNICGLRVRLPTRPDPQTGDDWAWVQLRVNLPLTVSAQARLHTPTVRVVEGRVRIDLPFSDPVPTPAEHHQRALGLDWGVSTLLTGTIGQIYTDSRDRQRVATDGVPLRYDATGISAKLGRLRSQRECLAAKLDQRQLLGMVSTALVIEHERCCAKIRHLNRGLAHSAARWALGQAQALGCTAIYVEDLATLESRGMSRKLNARLSGQVRGQVYEALRHQAAKVGIVVVSVPARGTSAGCPGCGRLLKHVASPDRLNHRGWHWSFCSHCHLSLDRDHAAARRIVARGLLGQMYTRKNKSGVCQIKLVVDGPVSRCLRKRNKLAQPQSSFNVCHPRPLRLRIPTPSAIVGGQRPVGHICRLEVAVGFGQGVFAQPIVTAAVPVYRRCRSRGAVLGMGFHLSVQASPIRSRGGWGLSG